jgi:hypothetical protein
MKSARELVGAIVAMVRHSMSADIILAGRMIDFTGINLL